MNSLSGKQITPELRDAWLVDRRKRIGASDAATAIGISPYKTRLQLWLEKTNVVDPEDLSENPYIEWGNRLEEPILKAYEEKTGEQIAKRQVYFISNQHPWMSCTVDGLRSSDGRIVEVKNVGAKQADKWGQPGTDEVPDIYLVQCAHQFHVFEDYWDGPSSLDVAVLIGGNDFRIYTINYNKKLIDKIVDLEREFVMCLESGIAPDPDLDNPKDQSILHYLYQESEAETELDLITTKKVDRWLRIKQDIADGTKEAKRLKAEIIVAIKNAERARLTDGRLLTRKIVHRQESQSFQKAYSYPNLRITRSENGDKIPWLTNTDLVQ